MTWIHPNWFHWFAPEFWRRVEARAAQELFYRERAKTKIEAEQAARAA